MSQKSSTYKGLCACVNKHYNEEQAARMLKTAERRYDDLCQNHKDYPKALRHHTVTNIFPAMGVFDALLAEGFSREEAAEELMQLFGEAMEAPAAMLRKVARFPGLYRKMPKIFVKFVGKQYGPDAGFGVRFYDLGADHAKLDVVECPYCRVCRELGYPEIIPVFCYSDDIVYGNMHPKLKWNRTQTIGRGGNCCDFDIKLLK